MKNKDNLILLKNKKIANIYPVEFGWSKCYPGYKFGPRIRKHYVIHYVMNGKGTFSNQNKTYNITAGQSFLIRPGEVCTYSADVIDPWKYI